MSCTSTISPRCQLTSMVSLLKPAHLATCDPELFVILLLPEADVQEVLGVAKVAQICSDVGRRMSSQTR